MIHLTTTQQQTDKKNAPQIGEALKKIPRSTQDLRKIFGL